MQWAGWRRVGVISSNTNLFSLAAQELKSVMYRAQMETALSVSFISGKFEPSSLKRIAASACRVTIVFAGAHDVIRIASKRPDARYFEEDGQRMAAPEVALSPRLGVCKWSFPIYNLSDVHSQAAA